ncbi:MAG: Ig-like domain repeat protein [Candidatus Heimdallarchaeota archaeon]|nr:Ig-like domain repeat protein [Candidatus Heimdallarchaeota archaeon]
MLSNIAYVNNISNCYFDNEIDSLENETRDQIDNIFDLDDLKFDEQHPSENFKEDNSLSVSSLSNLSITEDQVMEHENIVVNEGQHGISLLATNAPPQIVEDVDILTNNSVTTFHTESSSIPSPTMSINTRISLDNTGPTVGSIYYSPYPATDYDTIELTSEITDTDGVSWADLYYTYPGTSSWYYVSMSKAWFSDDWSADIGPFIGYIGTVSIFIQAMDNAGYDTVTSNSYFTVNPYDTTAPSIVTPTQYSPSPAYDNNEIEISSSSITDSGSDIDYVKLYYTQPGGSTYYSITMSKAFLSDKYYANIGPFNGMQGYVNHYIKAYDNYGNVRTTAIYNFYVSLWDTTAPSITTPTSYSPSPAYDNNEIEISSLSITDSQSGIDYVKLYYTKPGGSTYYSITMTKAYLSDKYYAHIGPYNGMQGDIKHYIKAYDNYGNVRTTSTYYIYVSLWDTIAPSITTPTSYSPSPAYDNNEIEISSSSITDSQSGIDYVKLYYTQPGGSTYYSITMSKATFSDKYYANIGPFSGMQGYINHYIKAYDEYGNVRTTATYNFYVSLWDTTAPSITTPTEYSPSPAYDNNEIEISSPSITDSQSDIDYVELYYTYPGESSYHTIYMEKALLSNKYYAHIGPFNGMQGDIKHYIKAYDNYGNVKITSTYYIYVSKWDTSAPIISIPTEYSPSPAYDNNEIEISSPSITDTQSGIDYVKLFYTYPGETTYHTIFMQKATLSNKYYANIGSFIGMEGYIYHYIEATDKYGNEISTSVYQFYVEIWDKTAPEIEEPLYADPIVAKDTDIINIYSNSITDDRSGISYVTLYYTFPGQNDFFPLVMDKSLFSDKYSVDIGPFFNQIGIVQLYIEAVDNYQNRFYSSTYEMMIHMDDEIVPENPTSLISTTHIVDEESFENVIQFEWSGATDDKSGVYGYSILLTDNINTEPDQVADIIHSDDPIVYTSEPLSPGEYWFKLITVDYNGNWAESSISLGSFIISSEIDLSVFDPATESIILAAINEIEDRIGVKFLDIIQDITFTVPLEFTFDTHFGAKFNIEITLSVTIINRMINIQIDANYALVGDSEDFFGNGQFYGPIAAFDQLLSKLDFLGLSPEFGFGGTFHFEFNFDLISREWDFIEYEGGMEAYIKVTYDYFQLFLMAFAPQFLPAYDKVNEGIKFFTHKDLSELINGYIKLSLSFTFGYNDVTKRSTVTLTPRFEASFLELDINDNDVPELSMALVSELNLYAFSEPAKKGIGFDLSLSFDFEFNLTEVIILVPELKGVYEFLSKFGFTGLYIRESVTIFDTGPIEKIWEQSSLDYQDGDSDGISDYDETQGTFGHVTNPSSADTDNDGINDGDEVFLYHTNPTETDSDGDGLTDYSEINGIVYDFYNDIYITFSPTNPIAWDSDNDFLFDSEEVLGWIWDFDTDSWIFNYYDGSDPLNADSDNDGFGDAYEVLIYLTNPEDYNDYPIDSDNDGIFDKQEIQLGTDPYNSDSDSDGIDDYSEVEIYDTDPLKEDTDDDLMADLWEITNNLDPQSDDAHLDRDLDGVTNYEEMINNTDPNNPDSDNDGLTDGQEVNIYDTNPNSSDSDNDGLTDGEEVNTYGTNPNSSDSDNDGLSDDQEVNTYSTNPNNPDSDNDGLNDNLELSIFNTDPNSSDSDNDGLLDGAEINIYDTNPNNSDSDNDGLSDGVEVNTYDTNPNSSDSDNDGISDYNETSLYNTNPTNPDCDNDGLLDGEEINSYNTDPLKSDSDNDGLLDGEEIITYKTDPTNPDTDSDDLNDYQEINSYNTNPNNSDSDSDGLEDGEEVNIFGTDPNNSDSDNDGIFDGEEVYNYQTNPNSSDSDYDGLTDDEEINTYLTDPNNADSDNDGLMDGEEVNIYFTDPNDNDSDNDELEDEVEINTYFTNPNNADSDNDGLMDGEEVNIYFTDPNDNDSDNDELEDEVEINTYFTNPNNADSDNDGLMDGEEINVYNTEPNDDDTDDDGANDGWEVENGTDPLVDDASLDMDNDGLTNQEEKEYNTLPNNPDSDSDGILDGDELKTFNTDPLDSDSDDDGLNDGQEVNTYTTDPLDADSDEDGLLDGEEVNTYTTDPLDADSDEDGLNDGTEVNTYNTDPANPDSDEDGLSDDQEVNTFTTDPLDSDSDDDGLSDGDEVNTHGTNPLNSDTDNDNLSDAQELNIYNTDPLNSDSDTDGLIDGDEVNTFTTDPLDSDSDDDDLIDGDEVNTYGIDPNDADSDDDELLDGEEVNTYNTDPTNPDSDIDGLRDGQEVNVFITDPLDSDSDNDGLMDGEEVYTYNTKPNDDDTDNDGLIDGWEVENGTNPLIDDSSLDIDNDGLTNQEEMEWNTNANNPDSDDDGLLDGEEVNTYGTNPNNADSDNDGLTDDLELSTYNTDPNNTDCDNDGLLDGEEIITYNTDPNNQDSDNDGLMDGDEVNIFNTNPNVADSDNDGLIDGQEVSIHNTDPLDPDSDSDGLTDGEEVDNFDTNPINSDSDNDGLMDGDEINMFNTNPLDSDSDNDGLIDGEEIDTYDTDPLDPDSDSDGLPDGAEVKTYGTNPNSSDSDNDGLSDIEELESYSTDPNNADSDNDGLSDAEEINTYSTDPLNSDSDNDGLSDGDEVNSHNTDPLNSDSDNDGLNDGDEINSHNTDPLNSDSDNDGLSDGDEVNSHNTDPLNSDSDNDGLTDDQELNTYNTNPNNPDTDIDGLSDGQEVYTFDTDPLDSDSDNDNLLDGDEVNSYYTDPNNPDSDNDGLDDGEEVNTYGTDPNNQDTDGDGINDGDEVANGSDPNISNNESNTNSTNKPTNGFAIIISLLSVFSFTLIYGKKLSF